MGGGLFKGAIILDISVQRGQLIETQLLFEGTLHSWSSSLSFSKMEYKAGNHPSPTVSIQDNDRFRLQPYSVRLWRWVDNSLLSESCMCLQNLFSVRLNFTTCWFLAGSPHQIIVSHPALVNVKRSKVICDVKAAAPRSTSLSPAKRAFFSFPCAQRPLAVVTEGFSTLKRI